MNSLTSLVSQISNAQKAGQASVAFVISDLNTSSKVFKFLNILVSEGFISHYSSSLSAQKGCLTVFLKYDGSGRPAIHRIFRVSNSSRRVYARSSAL
jgi:ribosomal protein S8